MLHFTQPKRSWTREEELLEVGVEAAEGETKQKIAALKKVSYARKSQHQRTHLDRARGPGSLLRGLFCSNSYMSNRRGETGRFYSSPSSGRSCHLGSPSGLKLRVPTKCMPWWKFTLNFPPP